MEFIRKPGPDGTERVGFYIRGDAPPDEVRALFEHLVQTAGGYRAAHTDEGEVTEWLCPHVHGSPAAARACPAKRRRREVPDA
ncbi:MAG: hypothetical protein WD004_03675 [Actinomycetota bacterium]